MTQPPILTMELVRRLERHVAPCESAGEEWPQVVRFGDAVARKARGAWPTSGVFCFGDAEIGRLREILDYFGEIDPVFYLSPAGFTPAVGEALRDAGFVQTDWQQAILYGLPTAAPSLQEGDICLERVTAETVHAAAEVAAEGNQWPAAWREHAKTGFRHRLNDPSRYVYLASWQDEPAGTAALSFGKGDGLCSLTEAAVVPRFRGRGVHRSLLSHRLHDAALRGCELVVGGADFGSTSFRNQQRLGMRLAYVESTWRRFGGR